MPPSRSKLGEILLLTTSAAAVVTAQQSSTMTRFLQSDIPEAVSFNSKLPCYPCITNGWIYCIDGTDHQHVDSGQYAPDGVCCENMANCAPISNPTYVCSSTYSDMLYSLRMCPFNHDSCGTQSEFVFKSAGSSLDTSLTFFPSDVCFYTVRSECGVPAFAPTGDGLSTVQITTIEFDDADVVSHAMKITDGSTTSVIYLPNKTESFDGQKKTSGESLLLYSKTEEDGSVTYFYQNGTQYNYKSPKVVTFVDDPKRDYMIIYPNGTNVTYNLDGTYTVTTLNNGVLEV